jgi:hypothetical protein
MRKQSNRLDFKAALFHFGMSVLLLLLCASSVFAEWYKDYDSALQASSKNQWPEAIAKLQSAINDRNEEAIHLRFYGTRIDDYFPHFHLGLAYYNIKNYQAAITEFQISEQQGAIKKVARLNSQLTNLQTLARAQLAAANAGQQDKTYETPAVPAQPQPNESTSENPSSPAIKPPVTPESQNPAEADMTAFKRYMRWGAKKYFEGDYDSAIRSFLAAVNVNQKEASGYFFLGCSYASKYLLGGSQDQKLLDKASIAFQKSKKIDPQYGANISYISPAVVEIYQKTSG